MRVREKERERERDRYDVNECENFAGKYSDKLP